LYRRATGNTAVTEARQGKDMLGQALFRIAIEAVERQPSQN